MKTRTLAGLCLFGLMLLLNSCTSVRYEGPRHSSLKRAETKILIVPLDNATDNEAAAVALTEMTASSLQYEGVSYVKVDDRPALSNAGQDWLSYAKERKCNYVLRGTVHEYHYKTDLDGDPAVGLSLRLINADNGETRWQGTSTATGFSFASVSSAAQQAVNKLVSNMFEDPATRHLP